ncbi:hypothetical protein R1flu_016388 [Riccia fluitans]|uniref:Uncharacterized protein n=1 Tax=Riccia fluitans TaxID=41844 RepID=A0ABD1YQK5_9MARC
MAMVDTGLTQPFLHALLHRTQPAENNLDSVQTFLCQLFGQLVRLRRSKYRRRRDPSLCLSVVVFRCLAVVIYDDFGVSALISQIFAVYTPSIDRGRG